MAVLTVHWERLIQPFVFVGAQRAVDLFFMLSGFVIALNYDERLANNLSPARFIVKRIVRLWPLHFLGTLMAALGIAAATLAHARVFWTWPSLAVFTACNSLMLPGPPDRHAGFALFPLNVPSWSLFWELVINLVYAAARRFLDDVTVMAIVVIAALVLLISIVHSGGGAGGFDWLSVPQGLLRVCFAFFMGVWLYRLHARGRLQWITLPAWIPLFAIVVILWVPTIKGSRALADAISIIFALPLIVAALISNEPTFGRRILTFLGLMSYPLYALHFAFGKYAEGLLEKVGHYQATDYAPYLGFALLALLGALCVVIERIYDQPVRERLSRFF